MKTLKNLFTIIFSYLLLPVSVAAQQIINLEDPNSQFSNIYALRPPQYVRSVVLILLGAAGVAAFIFLLLGGVQWITAGSDKDAVEKARKKILYALIGLIVTFSSYAAVFVIRALFQVDLFQLTIQPLGS